MNIKKDIPEEMWSKVQAGNEQREAYLMEMLRECANDPNAELTLRRMVAGFLTHKRAAERLLGRFEHAMHETKRVMAKNNIHITNMPIITPSFTMAQQDIPDSDIAITLMEAGFCWLAEKACAIEDEGDEGE